MIGAAGKDSSHALSNDPPISAAVAACLRAVTDDAYSYDGLVARRDNSRVHRARCDSKVIAIKECFAAGASTSGETKPDPESAERQFAALATVARRMSELQTQPLAPIPLVVCREHAVFAMTWAVGSPATRLVLARATKLAQAATLGKVAGNWLRRFHALHELPRRRSSFDEHLGYVHQLREDLGRRDRLILRAADCLVRQAAAASDASLPASWMHGDMKSDNLLVDGDSVIGLDIQMVHVNTVVYDMAPFLNHLCLLRWTPRGLWQRQKLDVMGEAFLRAYSPEAESWKLPIAWLRAYLLMQIVAPSNGAARRSIAVRWPARRELAKAIDKLDQVFSGADT